MKLASYNVENLFQRARAMDLATWNDGRPVLGLWAEMNQLVNKPGYSPADKKRIVEIMAKLGIAKKDDGGPFVILRQNRGHLVKRTKGGGLEVVANGRSDWIGWLDVKYGEVNEVATRNTAQVIRDVDADVLGVVEAENRAALLRFSKNLMPAVGGTPYEHIMLIDGNDDRGIDVALATRKGYDIESIRSHVDDQVDGNQVFSRDCPEYGIRTRGNNRLVVLVNHLKSKGFGSAADSNRKRERQARRVREIYQSLRAGGVKFIAVIGDFNDTPDSAPLAPLLQANLKDISAHPAFQSDGRPGTYGNGTKSNKIDYILLSPELFRRVTGGGVFRKGVWGGAHGTLWPIYPEMTKAVEAASDHAALWAELDV